MNSEKKYSENWEQIETDSELVANAMQLSERDLNKAEKDLREGDYDWALSIAYNAMLQAGRAIMFSKGARPTGEYKHVAVIEFIQKEFGKEFTDKLIFTLNKIRKKRHTAVYEQINIISKQEAEHAVNTAREFINKTKELLKKRLNNNNNTLQIK